MNIAEYINGLNGEPSDVKIRILKRLWSEGDSFPRGWVLSSELLELTGQKYFDRRVRELRDEFGCDIETGTYGGEHAYRLRSTEITIVMPRAYLPESKKQALFKEHDYKCAICDQAFKPGLRGLQADHKVPLSRSGSNDVSNWQPLCVECNVGKRRACADCDLDCETCPWAFPERLGRRIVLQLPANLIEFISELSSKQGTSLSDSIVAIIREYESNARS